MIRVFLKIILVFSIFSCNDKMEKNTVKVTYKEFDLNELILEKAGIELLDKFDIEIYSDKTFYTIFAAYYCHDYNEVPNITTLIDYHFIANNAFNQAKVKLFDTTFVEDKVECLLRVDKKTNVLMHNDSLYLAVMDDFEVAPITMKLDINTIPSTKKQIFKDQEVIPLCIKGLRNIHFIDNSKIDHFMLLGLVISDSPHKLDFRKMLDSEKVKFLRHLFNDGRERDINFDMIPMVDSFYIAKE